MIRNIEFSESGFLIIYGANDESRHHIQLCTVSGVNFEKAVYVSRYEVSPDEIHKFACKIYNGEHCSLFLSLMNTKIVVGKQPVKQFSKTGNDDDGIEDSLLMKHPEEPAAHTVDSDNEEYELMPVCVSPSSRTQKIIGVFDEYAGDVFFELPTASLKFALSRSSRDSLGTAILSLVNLRKSLPNLIDDKELVRVRDHPVVNPSLKSVKEFTPPQPPISTHRRSVTTTDLQEYSTNKSAARPKYHSNSELNKSTYSPIISSPLRSVPTFPTQQPFHTSSANLTPDTSLQFDDRFTTARTEKHEKRRSVIMKTPPPARPQSQHPSQSPLLSPTQSPIQSPASPKPSFDYSPSSPVRWLKRQTKIDHL